MSPNGKTRNAPVVTIVNRTMARSTGRERTPLQALPAACPRSGPATVVGQVGIPQTGLRGFRPHPERTMPIRSSPIHPSWLLWSFALPSNPNGAAAACVTAVRQVDSDRPVIQCAPCKTCSESILVAAVLSSAGPVRCNRSGAVRRSHLWRCFSYSVSRRSMRLAFAQARAPLGGTSCGWWSGKGSFSRLMGVGIGLSCRPRTHRTFLPACYK